MTAGRFLSYNIKVSPNYVAYIKYYKIVLIFLL